jgi:hypothetical protein
MEATGGFGPPNRGFAVPYRRSRPVFSGVVWRRFVAKTGYNQGVSYHLLTPHAIKFVSKSVSKNPVPADLGAIFERAFGSYASGGRLHIMDKCYLPN